MKLIESILFHLFPSVRDRIEEAERKASNAIIIAAVALKRSNECEGCVEVETDGWPSGDKDAGNN